MMRLGRVGEYLKDLFTHLPGIIAIREFKPAAWANANEKVFSLCFLGRMASPAQYRCHSFFNLCSPQTGSQNFAVRADQVNCGDAIDPVTLRLFGL